MSRKEIHSLLVLIVSFFDSARKTTEKIPTSLSSEFPLQGLRLVALDYTHGVSAEDERRSEDGEFGTFRKYLNRLLRGMPMAHELEEERRTHFNDDKAMSPRPDAEAEMDSATSTATPATLEDTREGSIASRESRSVPNSSSPKSDKDSASQKAPSRRPTRKEQLWAGVKSCVRHTFTPPTISLVCSIIIGVVPYLRNLFVAPDAANSHFSPKGPDGNPPLSTLYDAASFIGAASVPIGLIVLGASIAMIQIPRPSEFPSSVSIACEVFSP